MKKAIFYITAVLMAAVFLFTTAGAQSEKLSPSAYQKKLQPSTLLFMENKGQVVDDKGSMRADILFTANSGSAKIYLTANGIQYQFIKTEYPKGYALPSKKLEKNQRTEEELEKQIKTTTHKFTIALQGANLAATIVKEGQHNYFENYYLPQCPNGITGIKSYDKITFKNVYPKIDWVVYSKGGFIEYDFLVHPGGDPANIKLKVKDADAVSITPEGKLLIKTSLGEVKEKAPISYADGQIVSSRFKQSSDGSIGFDVQPQAEKELRIDPSVVWATYYGGSGGDEAVSTTVDRNGNVYIGGYTNSTVGVSAGGYQTTSGGSFDGMMVKFDSSGSRLWATYYGGTGIDQIRSCATDQNGNLYFCGQTNSATGIASGGFQNVIGGTDDGMLVKLNSSGIRVWATYYGSTSYNYAYCCSVDRNGNVYISGETNSTSGIAYNGHQNIYGGSNNSDAFLVKFNPLGNRLWATYYGGTNDETGTGCAVDGNGNVFLSGSTKSVNNIAFNGHQNTWTRDWDAYLTKFDSLGTRLWGTYYGSPGIDESYACATDVNGNVYLCGETDSISGIAFNGFQNNYAGRFDAFLVKFNSLGTRQWGTYYGGSKEEFGYACCVDSIGNVYLSGETSSLTGIAYNGVQNSYGGSYNDAFIVRFNSSGIREWGSYYGGSDQDGGLGCVANGSNVFLTGYSRSTTNIALGGFQNVLNGTTDAFLAKIKTSPTVIIACPGGSASATSNVIGNLYQWETSPNGVNWTNVVGQISSTLQLSFVQSTSYGYFFRCRVDGSIYSDLYQLKFQNVWTGTVSTAWENPANWSCGILPDGNTDVIINNGPVLLSSNGICRTLMINPGVSFTITSGNTLTITH